MRAARIVFMWLERAFLAGLVLQLFFIGFGVFPRNGDSNPFGLHKTWGFILGDIAVVLFLIALAARAGRRTVLLALVVGLLTFLAQPLLVSARHKAPFVASLHPRNALLMSRRNAVALR